MSKNQGRKPTAGQKATERVERPSQLMDLVFEEAASRGLTAAETAGELGVSPSYLFALRNGPRQEDKIGRDVIEAISKFLGISVYSVMKISGIIKPTDFLSPDSDSSRARELSRALKFIRNDEEWMGLIPDREFDEEMQIALIRIYERATGRILIRSKPMPQMSD